MTARQIQASKAKSTINNEEYESISQVGTFEWQKSLRVAAVGVAMRITC